MSTNKDETQMINSEETIVVIDKKDDSLKKTAFNWNLFESRTEVLKDLREKQEFVDLMLITEDGHQEITHFAVVSALGKQFTQYIDNELKSAKDNEVVLQNGSVVNKVLVKGIIKSTLKTITDYSYSASFRTNYDDVWPLIEASLLYSIEDIMDLSLNYLKTQLNVENCVKLFNLGLKYSHKLSNDSYLFIRNNFSDIVGKSKELSDIGLNELKELIVDDGLNIASESLVFKAIIRWINGDIIHRKDKLFSLISKIRFGRLESTFIETEMANNQLILEDRLCIDLVSKMAKDYEIMGLSMKKDGNGLFVGLTPIEVRPRIPHEIMLAFRGGYMRTIECYDNRTNLWFETMVSNGEYLWKKTDYEIEVIDGLIYVIGGYDGIKELNTVECFNPITKIWSEKSSLNECRCYVSVVSINGIIYAMGGRNRTQRLNTCEKYDPICDKWTHFEPMNRIRSAAKAIVHQNRIYIAGGFNGQQIENSVEFYDLNEKTWSFMQPMLSPRDRFGFVSLNDFLYAIGGDNGFERLKSVERYDFRNKTWVQMADMSSRRRTFGTSILENQLYVIGGNNGQNFLSSVERYDSNENVWTKVTNMESTISYSSVCSIKGLSNSIDYSFIGINTKKDENKFKTLSTKSSDPQKTVIKELLCAVLCSVLLILFCIFLLFLFWYLF